MTGNRLQGIILVCFFNFNLL